jgi:hypothetical protein
VAPRKTVRTILLERPTLKGYLTKLYTASKSMGVKNSTEYIGVVLLLI